MPLTRKYLLDLQVYMDLQVYASLRGRRLPPAPPLPVRLVPEVRAQTTGQLVHGGALAELEQPPTAGPPALEHRLNRRRCCSRRARVSLRRGLCRALARRPPQRRSRHSCDGHGVQRGDGGCKTPSLGGDLSWHEAHTCCSNRIRSSLFERMDLRPCSSTCKYLQVLGHRLSNKYLGSFSWRRADTNCVRPWVLFYPLPSRTKQPSALHLSCVGESN